MKSILLTLHSMPDTQNRRPLKKRGDNKGIHNAPTLHWDRPGHHKTRLSINMRKGRKET